MEEKHISEKAAGCSLFGTEVSRRLLADIVRRFICVICSVSMMLQPVLHTMPVSAAEGQAAVTFQELNENTVFLKQSQARVCTLTSSAMMVRRAAMLMGNKNWQQITEQSVRKDAWLEGVGLKWDFTTYGIAVTHKTLASKEELVKMLDEHPEGIVIYNSRKPHAVLATDYTDGVIYCSDPSNDMPSGRYPISQASITVESAGRCWYVKRPTGMVVQKSEQDTNMGDYDTKNESQGNNGSKLGDPKDGGSENVDDDSVSPKDSEDKSTGNDDAENKGSVDKDVENKESMNGNVESEKYEADGLVYRILNTQDMTAVCIGQQAAASSVVVPDTVILDGAEYRIVAIEDRAFANVAKLKSITIGTNVLSIGAKAFYRCKKLKSVMVNAENLQSIGADAFAQIHKKAKIYILADKIEEFGKLLTGTSVPTTVVVKVNRVSAEKAGKKV